MKHALFFFAVPLLSMTPVLPMALASGGVPELNPKTICEARSAGDKMMRLAPVETVAECVAGENNAKQQLTTLWDKIPAPTRTRCISDARALGTTSYLDFVTCMQMTEELQAQRNKDASKL